MKASEMTNEMLAMELLETVGLDSPSCQCDRCMAVREVAARLRKVDTYCKVNEKQDIENVDLRRRLKAAEDALDTIYKCVDNKRGVDVSLLVKSIIADNLAAIRKEGCKS